MTPYGMSLCALARSLRAGELTATEVLSASLARCAELEPQVQAWQHVDAERSLQRAAALDFARASGQPPGLLHGVPIAVKDIIDVAGMPTTMGSALYADNVPARSARVVEQLEALGAVVVGKTVTTEFAYYTPGKTRNPWNIAHTPGGSSSGSAAAVATGMVAGALGTQTNGSIIRPAAYCGIVGFKPSFGRVANEGTLDPWPSLDHTGVLVRCVADAALLMSAMTREPGQVGAAIVARARPPRLAAVRTPVWAEAHAAQIAAFADALAVLRGAGAEVIEAELPPLFEQAHATMRVIMAYEAARHFGELVARARQRVSAQFQQLVDIGGQVSADQYQAALDTAAQLRALHAEFLRDYDAIITPPVPGEAPATLAETGSPVFCTIWSLLGVPAVTTPVAHGPNGLPLGVQVTGRYDADDALLAVAAWCEAQLPFAPLNL